MLLLLVMQLRKLSLYSKRESGYLKHTLMIKSIPRCTSALYLDNIYPAHYAPHVSAQLERSSSPPYEIQLITGVLISP